MADVAIRVEGLGKLYRIGAAQERHDTLRDALMAGLRAPLARLRRNGHAPRDGEKDSFWALRDVLFEVKRGEVLGIIGRNGAGKSTLLKILSRITEPTEGRALIHGRVGSLLEVGTGFHPELTGRENIHLNGAILGMRKCEITRRFDEIVAFAEVERFLDTPVKRYSSGMYVRLAFAVAAHLEPEVLLVDEVLAVGDMGFQRKCLEHMRRIRSDGASILFVSHNMPVMQSLCERVLWLKQGAVHGDGSASDLVGRYLSDTAAQAVASRTPSTDPYQRWGSGEVMVRAVRLLDECGHEVREIPLGRGLAVEVSYHAGSPVRRPNCGVAVLTDDAVRVVTATTNLSGSSPETMYGQGQFRCFFEALPLVPGAYSINVSIYDQEDAVAYDRWGQAAAFAVVAPSPVSLGQQVTPKHGIIHLPATWSFGTDDPPGSRPDGDEPSTRAEDPA